MLSTGQRLRSQVCTTEIIVIRAADVALLCGGHPMIPIGTEPATLDLDPEASSGNQIGKRYTDAEGSVEILVTKAGSGTLATTDAALALKSATPLPSSD